jgi:hypothetical protein
MDATHGDKKKGESSAFLGKCEPFPFLWHFLLPLELSRKTFSFVRRMRRASQPEHETRCSGVRL